MLQPSQQHVALCVKGVEWGLGTRGLRMVVAFWAGISVSSAIGTPFWLPETPGNDGRILPPAHKG